METTRKAPKKRGRGRPPGQNFPKIFMIRAGKVQAGVWRRSAKRKKIALSEWVRQALDEAATAQAAK